MIYSVLIYIVCMSLKGKTSNILHKNGKKLKWYIKNYSGLFLSMKIKNKVCMIIDQISN